MLHRDCLPNYKDGHSPKYRDMNFIRFSWIWKAMKTTLIFCDIYFGMGSVDKSSLSRLPTCRLIISSIQSSTNDLLRNPACNFKEKDSREQHCTWSCPNQWLAQPLSPRGVPYSIFNFYESSSPFLPQFILGIRFLLSKCDVHAILNFRTSMCTMVYAYTISTFISVYEPVPENSLIPSHVIIMRLFPLYLPTE